MTVCPRSGDITRGHDDVTDCAVLFCPSVMMSFSPSFGLITGRQWVMECEQRQSIVVWMTEAKRQCAEEIPMRNTAENNGDQSGETEWNKYELSRKMVKPGKTRPSELSGVFAIMPPMLIEASLYRRFPSSDPIDSGNQPPSSTAAVMSGLDQGDFPDLSRVPSCYHDLPGAGFFFVGKKDGSLQPCIDYSALNDISVKNRYPLPLISSAFEKAEKCEFHASSVSFLGFIVSTNQVKMDPEKNAKPDALSCLYEPELAAREPEPILPLDRVVGAVSWWIEKDVQQASQGVPVPEDCPHNRLFVPEAWRSQVIHWAHASLLTCHPGIKRTVFVVQQRFWWPSLVRDVAEYVGVCSVCARSKASSSSGYHPESNGQTERSNQELETCLRCLVAQNQTTWSNHLTWVEYAHNTLPTAATRLSPFQVMHGYQPLLLFPANEEEVTVPSVHALTRRCKKIWAAASWGQAKPQPPPQMVDGGPVYAIKKLLVVRKRGQRRQFLDDWEG
ncbi:hypothetical protein L3Q82_004053 [Scortum barcoo]|uniref:Uncharacterized protein n=1 Tax=Scortum barcoo TaxID=214431 RepID=A0ACB8X638_9TELE|nr:hypothetical protein L3Q82_004053 [Scortum barcoo]